MTVRETAGDQALDALEIERFDLSTLVGRKVTLYAEQFPGKPLTSRVTVAAGKAITIDRSGHAGLIANLVNNQRVVLQIVYKGEPVSVSAVLRRTEGGGCRIYLGDTVTPLRRRRFCRVPIACPFRLAALPIARLAPTGLSRLRWLETETVNLSGGGALIVFTSVLEPRTYLFVNVGGPELGFPSLLLGQVRHSSAVETGRWHVGLQFIAREDRNGHLPFPTVRPMPGSVFALDQRMQREIERKLIAWMHEQNAV
ncbi:MAG TPA: hypothetical protein PKM94_00600 [candidate division Zixibacteria bacterium]|nr:hypothetical protein [candidate division Zixibacteria bacterium]